jgi:hypothetical protein
MAELFALIFQLYEDEFLQKKSFRLRENSKYYFYSYMKMKFLNQSSTFQRENPL